MPKLWDDSIEAHRRAVREAALDATAALVAKHGLRAVTMSRIAEETGIGRATLYKYFPDVEAILSAWHERKISGHLARLAELRDKPGPAVERLRSVFEGYASIQQDVALAHGAELAALLHRGTETSRGLDHLHELFSGLLAEGVETGQLRSDVPPSELATYCLHALTAASSLPSKAAVRRLVAVIVSAVRTQE